MLKPGRTRWQPFFRRSRLWFNLPVLLMLLVVPFEARPQANPGAAELEEIIVTARRVEENVQDVPMSVQVLSGELLDQLDATRLFDLQFNIPGLVVNVLGMNGAGFRLRGVSQATHLDGVYSGDATLSIARMFDLERIEVLKGPQGTLYGRNSTGGSMNFITRKPADEFSAEVEGSYGSFDTVRSQGHVNVPFGPAAVRLAFIRSEGDGYVRNSIDDRVFGESDYTGLRASLRVPLNDRLRLDLVAQRVTDDGASGELWSPNPVYLPDPTDIRLTTVRLPNPFLLTETDNLTLFVDYDVNGVHLQSITGIAHSDVLDIDDCEGTPALRGCIRGYGPLDYRQRSQEFHVLGQAGAVDWLVGAQYFESFEATKNFLLVPSRNLTPLNDSDFEERQTAYAVFTQATWPVAGRWSVTAGLRRSYQQGRVAIMGSGVNDSATWTIGRDDWGDTTWRIDLAFAATDDVNLYAGVSTGFNSGGIVGELLSTGELDTFDSEKLTAFEVGVKAQWLERRATVNAAAFFYDFDDMQVSTVLFTQQQQVFEIDNAAQAELYGIDADGVLHVSDRWSVSGGLVWLPKREFVDYRNARTGDTLSGNKIIRSPEWTSTVAIAYRRPVSSLGSLAARVEYHYRSGHFFSNDNDPSMSQGDFTLLNVFLGVESSSANWQLYASGRNLGDTDYFNQVLLQSSPGYPDTYEVGIGYRF